MDPRTRIWEVRDLFEREEHIRKHKIRAREILQVIENEDSKRQLKDFQKYGLRLIVLGTTDGGRALKILLAPIDIGKGIWRFKTAVEMEDHEKKRFL